MIVGNRTVTIPTYQSEHFPEVYSEQECEAEIIAFIDAHPSVYRMVTESKSEVWKWDSSEYYGYQRSQTVQAALSRVGHFKNVYEKSGSPENIWRWRAHFSYTHYSDKGFTGGFFQQHDEKYPRGGLSFDYTPETFRAVLARFVEWCETGSLRFPTHRVTVKRRKAIIFDEQWKTGVDSVDQARELLSKI